MSIEAMKQWLEALKTARWRIANLVGPEGAQGLDRAALTKIDAAITSLIQSIAEAEKERCTGCEACIDSACGRDECPKGWAKAEKHEVSQEPVAWGNFKKDGTLVGLSQHPEDQTNWTNRKPLYTHPQPKREPL